MKPRLILVLLGLALGTMLSFGLQAQEQPKTSGSAQAKDDILTTEQQSARQFAEFMDALLRLKQRLARGTPEEKRRSEVLGKVLEECKNLAINQEFSKMIEVLRTAKLTTTDELATARGQSEELTRRLRLILDLLQNSSTDASKERKDLEQLIKDLQKAIDQQKTVQAQTDLNKTDKDELKNTQAKVTENTSKVEQGLKKYLDKDKENQGGEAANPKGENKEGKGEGKKGEAKDAGKDPKSSEASKGEIKDAGKDSPGAKGEAKPGENKKDPGPSSKNDSDPKSDAKPGEKTGADSKEAGSKENKSGAKGQEGASKDNQKGEKSPAKDPEGSAKDSGAKAGDPKDDKNPQGAVKSGDDDKKPGSAAGKKDGAPESQAKSGEKSGADSKEAGAKESKEAGGAKSGESKNGDAKSGESKSGSDSKQGAAKSGSDSKGQGEAKDGGSPSQGQDSPPQQAAQKGDNSPPPSGNPPPSSNKQNDDVAKANKKVKEAGYDQQQAEDKIDKGDNPLASKKQADAIRKMEDAKKKLERLLQQMREDELERVLAALQNRCEKMLAMQIQVLAGTEDVDKAITARNADKKPNAENKKEALKLSDQEKQIVQEANKCIDILEAEGSAVAFPEVFQQIRQDMIHVQKRLELTDVQDVTQGIERDIIDTLKEMIEALKKARQDMQPSDSKPGKEGKSGPPSDKKLLELIQELKMVRSLQKRVNDRTELYGRRFVGQEQANEPQVIRELRSLSERQLRIQDIVSRIAKGDNK